MGTCPHPHAKVLEDLARKRAETRMIMGLRRIYPDAEDEEIEEAATSPRFEYFYCPTCNDTLIKLA